LSRGYAMALDASGRAVTNSSALAAGDRLQVVLARGRAGVRVEAVDDNGPDSGESAH